jgi:hypothetical protein
MDVKKRRATQQVTIRPATALLDQLSEQAERVAAATTNEYICELLRLASDYLRGHNPPRLQELRDIIAPGTASQLDAQSVGKLVEREVERLLASPAGAQLMRRALFPE